MVEAATDDGQYDILILGAGLSGIGMACHLARDCPGKRVGLLERRQALGGTWDLFRYPGVRSDSDMLTFGYAFRPWNELKVLADGPSIRRYIEETAREYGIDRAVRYGVDAIHATWSSERRNWTVTVRSVATGLLSTLECRFLIACTGYYRYDDGYLPDYPGLSAFQGCVVHPQHWPEDLDYRGKRVVVIGSGATAVTIVPAMAIDAAHVIMLQRSPTYIFSIPSRDKISAVLKYILPAAWVYRLARKRNIALQRFIYKAAQRWPQQVGALLRKAAGRQLAGQANLDDFTPRYAPWEQRPCAVPDGDLFKAIREGKVSVLTDTIDTFTAHGIRLQSGRQLDADIVVSATGFQLQSLGGMTLDVDGVPRVASELMTYKSVLLQDTPNMAVIFGYANASWTLKVDIAATYVCRLLNHMNSQGIAVSTPRAPPGLRLEETILDQLSSGYVRRGGRAMPRQGRAGVWRVTHNYETDRAMLLRESIDDDALLFER
ncbi:MAG TPA: NAD(P)/FAD-dependent oxidoreductase [Dyella sp.]|uniref:flavin-containing monooxygenase n=1 Tax=Dyella sp. TaxID=1869338 RepID=UPI002F934118